MPNLETGICSVLIGPLVTSAVMRTQCAIDFAKRIQSLYTSSLQRTHLIKT